MAIVTTKVKRKYNNMQKISNKTITELNEDLFKDIISIRNNAFYNCTSLTSINLPSSLTRIGNNAFQGCTSLASVNLPSSLTTIGSYAFQDCTSLTSISFPSSLTAVNSNAFENTGLTSVTIPSGMPYNAFSVFRNCKNLKSVTLSGPIGPSWFSGCTSLEKLTINDANALTHGGTFENLTSINDISLVDDIVIPQNCFYGCTGIESVIIPQGASLGAYAFGNCTSLASVTVNDTTPISCTSFTFNNTSPNLVIYVPAESVEAYKAASGWSSYAGRIQAIPSE